VVGELIMLPVRVGVRATQLWLRAAEETLSVASSATTRLVGLAAARSSGSSGGAATMPRPDAGFAQDEPASADTAPPAPRPAEAAGEEHREDENGAGERPAPATPGPDSVTAARSPAAPAESEPVHVSEEPALVEELAEPGAEDGAGAEVHVMEPWEGYAGMNAREIISRLAGTSPAELAAVQLYESSHRKRQTILNAVQRELRSGNGRSV
jgi:hypothetical protein